MPFLVSELRIRSLDCGRHRHEMSALGGKRTMRAELNDPIIHVVQNTSMISFLLFVAATQAWSRPAPAPPSAHRTKLTAPTPTEIAEARASTKGDLEARRTALQAAIESRVVSSGYFQLVTDVTEQRRERTRFQERLRAVGIPAALGVCHWMGLVPEGTARGNRSYGGACSVKIGSRSSQNFLICAASLGGITLVHPDAYAFDAEYIELFIRRTCL